MDLKMTNEKIGYLSTSQDKISREITAAFNDLQKSTSIEMTKELGNKLNYLTDLHKKLKVEYNEILQRELSVLYKNWPDIFEKIQEGIDRETLDNVLTVFENVQNGKMSKNEALSNGMDFMSKKYNLPSDFFNKNAVDTFNKNMHKLT
jgi:flagellin-specific chaperone FliS